MKKIREILSLLCVLLFFVSWIGLFIGSIQPSYKRPINKPIQTTIPNTIKEKKYEWILLSSEYCHLTSNNSPLFVRFPSKKQCVMIGVNMVDLDFKFRFRCVKVIKYGNPIDNLEGKNWALMASTYCPVSGDSSIFYMRFASKKNCVLTGNNFSEISHTSYYKCIKLKGPEK